MAWFRGMSDHLPWLMMHNIKPTDHGSYHIKGFHDCSIYSRNKWGLKIDTWVESPCMRYFKNLKSTWHKNLSCSCQLQTIFWSLTPHLHVLIMIWNVYISQKDGVWLDASMSMLASDHTMHKVLHWNIRIFGGIPEHSVNNRIFGKIPNTMKFRWIVFCRIFGRIVAPNIRPNAHSVSH